VERVSVFNQDINADRRVYLGSCDWMSVCETW
jgi:hypothetical protein